MGCGRCHAHFKNMCSGVDLVNSGLLNMKLVPSKQVESIRQLESVDTYERNLRKLA